MSGGRSDEWLREKLSRLIATSRVPEGVTFEAVFDAAETYTAREPVIVRMAASDARAEIEALIKMADKLADRLATMPDEIRNAMIATFHKPKGEQKNPAADAVHALTSLAYDLKMMEQHIAGLPTQTAKPARRRAVLVKDLAEIIESAGGLADARAGGPLVTLLAEVLEWSGEKVKKPATVAKTALSLRQHIQTARL